VLNITCTGESDYIIHSECPITDYSEVCNILSGSLAIAAESAEAGDSRE